MDDHNIDSYVNAMEKEFEGIQLNLSHEEAKTLWYILNITHKKLDAETITEAIVRIDPSLDITPNDLEFCSHLIWNRLDDML